MSPAEPFGHLPIYTDKDVPAGTIDLYIEPTDEKPTGLYVNPVDMPRLRVLLLAKDDQ